MKRVKTMGRKYILYNSLAGNGKCMYDVQALADTYPDAILKKMTEIASYAEFMGSLAEDDEVILCGGDGTLNIFVNDIKDMDVKNTIYYYAFVSDALQPRVNRLRFNDGGQGHDL
jgi:diacylglycerol kinase family enzyme